ncbi:MAG TPA: hypothetical protein VEI07_21070, partial [Planctomycetaceae bacterium]|nr:hypothetical protein [Planctomycetaceae bacterium]
MSQAIVSRILWKEARVQRPFWVWVLGLGLFIQLLPAILGQHYYRGAVDVHWFASVNIVVACCFAVGSTAIAFAGETENRTKLLFQRLPVRSGQLLTGKLVWCVLGTYALALILAMTAKAWGGPAPVAVPNNRPGLDPDTWELWLAVLLPIPFLLVGVLVSLAFRDVLTTVAVTGVTTAILCALARGDTMPANPAPLVLAGIVLAAVAVADALLVRHWIRDTLAIPSIRRMTRLIRTRTESGHSTLSVRSSVAWKRATSSLLWKEFRQAVPLTVTMAAACAVLLLVCGMLRQESPRPFQEGWGGLV